MRISSRAIIPVSNTAAENAPSNTKEAPNSTNQQTNNTLQSNQANTIVTQHQLNATQAQPTPTIQEHPKKPTQYHKKYPDKNILQL